MLIKDGKVLAALCEERSGNIKYYNSTPECVIREVFRIAKVDLIVVVGLAMTHAPLKERPLNVNCSSSSPYVACHIFAKLYVRLLHRFRTTEYLRRVWWNRASKTVRSMKSYLSQLLVRVNRMRCSILF